MVPLSWASIPICVGMNPWISLVNGAGKCPQLLLVEVLYGLLQDLLGASNSRLIEVMSVLMEKRVLRPCGQAGKRMIHIPMVRFVRKHATQYIHPFRVRI